MLDPLTALSLAGNIIQFVDFGTKVLAKGHELYKSTAGASIDHTELETIAKDLQEINDRLRQRKDSQETQSKTATDSEVALRKLSEQCSGVAEELIGALEKLKVQGTSNRRWKSFRQALKGLMKKEELDAITIRLQHFRDELNLHILVSMRYAIKVNCSPSAKSLQCSNKWRQTDISQSSETPLIWSRYDKRKAFRI